MYLLCFSVFPIWSITFGLLRQCGGGELGRRFSLARRAMERVAARSACGDQRGGSPRSSAVQCESSSPLQLLPPLTMVLHCFSSGSTARDGDLCGEGREEGGALMRYSQLQCLSTASVRSMCSSYLGEDDQVPRGDLHELISRGPPGTPSPSPVAVSMSPWLSRST